MLEIILLIFLCTHMGKKLRAKGWKPLWMQIGVVFAWIGGAFFGVFAYVIWIALREGEAAVQDLGFSKYPFAILGGLGGVGIFFLIAAMLPVRNPPPLVKTDA
jgi:hypothetical protein